jgi:hypothetical protein
MGHRVWWGTRVPRVRTCVDLRVHRRPGRQRRLDQEGASDWQRAKASQTRTVNVPAKHPDPRGVLNNSLAPRLRNARVPPPAVAPEPSGRGSRGHPFRRGSGSLAEASYIYHGGIRSLYLYPSKTLTSIIIFKIRIRTSREIYTPRASRALSTCFLASSKLSSTLTTSPFLSTT